MADFDILEITENPTGWGPSGVPHDQFKDLPYQPFSKSDKIGKVADWTGATYSDKRMASKYMPQYGGGGQYSYFQDEDEGSFQLVDQSRLPSSNRGGGRGGAGGRMGNGRFSQRGMRGGRGGPGGRGGGNMNQNMNNRNRRGQQGMGQGPMNAGAQGNRNRFQKSGRNRYDQKGQPMKKRDASVYIKNTWRVVDELDFPRLSKLNLPGVSDPEDLYMAGGVEYYDKSYDRCSAKNPKPLQRINRIFHKVTTMDDPIIRQLTRTSSGRVFATDSIVATLMCASRSVASWDIVVQKVKDKLFFDKRDDSAFDLLTVNETAMEVPYANLGADAQDAQAAINAPRNLALEATYINHNFSQQVLRMGEERVEFEHPNPFIEEGEEAGEAGVASVAYRYRKFNLGSGGMDLIIRTEHDAATLGPNNETQYINIKALNEWDPRFSGGIDWRQKLDGQRGAVLANELKNNSCKLAKWTVQALLAGSDHIKFGYVSRAGFRDSSKHAILAVQQFKPKEFADQINLNMDNAWGVLRCIVDMFMKMPDGKYLLLKDPNKPALVIYDIPDNSFDSDEGEEEVDEALTKDAESIVEPIAQLSVNEIAKSPTPKATTPLPPQTTTE